MFAYTRKAQYHETDQMGIIHHANYIKWMEEARLAYLEKLGLSKKEIAALKDRLVMCVLSFPR